MKECVFVDEIAYVMKISDRRLRISDSLKNFRLLQQLGGAIQNRDVRS